VQLSKESCGGGGSEALVKMPTTRSWRSEQHTCEKLPFERNPNSSSECCVFDQKKIERDWNSDKPERRTGCSVVRKQKHVRNQAARIFPHPHVVLHLVDDRSNGGVTEDTPAVFVISDHFNPTNSNNERSSNDKVQGRLHGN
jgi:hypothetical protein